MPTLTHPTRAADLLVQGTYALRFALDQLIRSGALPAVDSSEHSARAVPVATDIPKKSDLADRTRM